MTSKQGKPQPTYDENFKASAVARLIAEGYPTTRGALAKAAKALSISHVTLRAWAKGKAGAPPPKLVEITVSAMIGVLDAKIEAILDAIGTKTEGASFRDLALAYGILFDKRQLLTGKPTSRSVREVRDMRTKSNDELEDIIRSAQGIAKNGPNKPAFSPAGRKSGTGTKDIVQ